MKRMLGRIFSEFEVALVALAVAAITLMSVASAQSPSESTRILAFNSYNDYFYISDGGNAYYKNQTGITARNQNFWQNAEMIECAEDAYDFLQTSQHAAIVSALCNDFIAQHGTDWSGNSFNDDVMWAAIVFARAKLITGDDSYGQTGASNFNMVWNRAWDTTIGGGLWWTTSKKTKNACVNGPGAIAALLFYQMGYGDNYLNQAQMIYEWERAYLIDPTTGKVNDHIDASGNLVDWTFTYNQGTWAGAGALLYNLTIGGLTLRLSGSTYANDARLAILWTQNNLCGQHVAGTLNDEYPDRTSPGSSPSFNDGAGFKSIFARWAGKYVSVTGDTEFNPWLQQNANEAWDYRNSAGVTWAQWWHRTSDESVSSWECAAALSTLLNCPA